MMGRYVSIGVNHFISASGDLFLFSLCRSRTRLPIGRRMLAYPKSQTALYGHLSPGGAPVWRVSRGGSAPSRILFSLSVCLHKVVNHPNHPLVFLIDHKLAAALLFWPIRL